MAKPTRRSQVSTAINRRKASRRNRLEEEVPAAEAKDQESAAEVTESLPGPPKTEEEEFGVAEIRNQEVAPVAPEAMESLRVLQEEDVPTEGPSNVAESLPVRLPLGNHPETEPTRRRVTLPRLGRRHQT